jgi:hypothetical protein
LAPAIPAEGGSFPEACPSNFFSTVPVITAVPVGASIADPLVERREPFVAVVLLESYLYLFGGASSAKQSPSELNPVNISELGKREISRILPVLSSTLRPWI